MRNDEPLSTPVSWEIPTKTLIKLCFTAVVIAIVLRVLPLLALVSIPLILAVSVHPLVQRCEKWTPRWFTIALIAILSLALMGLLCFGVFPPLSAQVALVLKKAPGYLQKNLQHSAYGQTLYSYLESHFKPVSANSTGWVQSVLDMGQVALEGMSSVILIYVFFIYFLVDGPRAYAWFLAFFSTKTKAKMEETFEEVSSVISAYIFGQVITSVLAALYVFISLRVLGVPAALMLAVLAGVFDVLPVLGFFCSLIPAVVFAMTVSPQTAFIVVGLYVLYHGIENYLVLPYVYGSRLRLSGLVVLFSLLAAGLIGGLIGAIIALPIVASYPIVEKIWLIGFLKPQVIREHASDES
jgi:predicted PurR-regulated permease PerM